MAFSVSRRTREIGIRIALGAAPHRVTLRVVSEGVLLALFGAAIGIAGALGSGRLIERLLYDVSPSDPASLFAASFLLIGVTALASYLPARRTAQIQPSTALRYE